MAHNPKKNRNQKCGNIIYTCENCNHQVEFHLNAKPIKEEKRKEEKEKTVVPSTFPSFPVCVQLKHNGFWITTPEGVHKSTLDVNCDRNSVMLSNDCLLYVYKLALRHFLLSRQVITPQEIDAANLVPHVMVRKNKTDPFSKYSQIQGEKFIITEKMLSVRSDFLLIELDEKRDLHMTLIYSKKIKSRGDLVAALKTVLQTLNQHPELIEEYSKLEYFGQEETNYWFHNPDSYPLKIKTPLDYIPKAKEDFKIKNLSPAGSILE